MFVSLVDRFICARFNGTLVVNQVFDCRRWGMLSYVRKTFLKPYRFLAGKVRSYVFCFARGGCYYGLIFRSPTFRSPCHGEDIAADGFSSIRATGPVRVWVTRYILVLLSSVCDSKVFCSWQIARYSLHCRPVSKICFLEKLRKPWDSESDVGSGSCHEKHERTNLFPVWTVIYFFVHSWNYHSWLKRSLNGFALGHSETLRYFFRLIRLWYMKSTFFAVAFYL